jgi:hypothetical protein
MMKKLLILGMFLFMVGVVNADWCYQETANVSTACGGLDTGSYVNMGGSFDLFNQLYDGIWTSYAIANIAPSIAYINYSVPSETFDAKWQVKDMVGLVNLSIPEGCLNLNPLQLMIHVTDVPFYASWQCWDGNSWNMLRNNAGSHRIYEEGMYWSFEEQPPSGDCDYYIGDEEFALPQITTTKVPDDSPTHKMYLACLYSLDGSDEYEIMTGQICRASPQMYDPDDVGTHTYDLAIFYRERQWDEIDHQWITIGEGVDNYLNTTFTVCGVPGDEEGWDDFIDTVSNWWTSLADWLCGIGWTWFC